MSLLSRLGGATEAVRPALPAKLSIAAARGGGKTYTGLEILSTLVGPEGRILGIDTERGSMRTYADLFRFSHLNWRPPYNPSELAATITDACGEYDGILVDSVSHFWSRDGGTLDIADNKFGGWKAARPAQEDLYEAIQGCTAHLIVTMRAKMDYAQRQENGRTVIEPVGMAPVQDDGMEYEVNVALDMDLMHRITVTKSRTLAVPVGHTWAPGAAQELAKVYGEWLAGGLPPATDEEKSPLLEAIAALDEAQARWAREEWNRRGIPPLRTILAANLPAAVALVEEARQVAPDKLAG